MKLPFDFIVMHVVQETALCVGCEKLKRKWQVALVEWLLFKQAVKASPSLYRIIKT